MDTILALAYIENILKDPNVELIEVWERVLYVRMKQGCGRNTFKTKNGLEFKLYAYYRPEEFKRISKRYHPDLQRSNTTKTINDTKDTTELQANIILSREALKDYRDCGRTIAAVSFVHSLKQFVQLASAKTREQRDRFIRAISKKLDSAGFTNTAGLSQRRWGTTGSIFDYTDNNQPEIIQRFAKAWRKAVDEAEKGYPVDFPEGCIC